MIVSCVIALPSVAAFLGGMTGLAIDSCVVNVGGQPADLAGGCLFAQPLAAHTAMGFSRRLCLLHMGTLCLSSQLSGRVTGINPTFLITIRKIISHNPLRGM